MGIAAIVAAALQNHLIKQSSFNFHLAYFLLSDTPKTAAVGKFAHREEPRMNRMDTDRIEPPRRQEKKPQITQIIADFTRNTG
jgi:hypothetical protein